MSAIVVRAGPTSRCSCSVAATIRSRVSRWRSARAFSLYARWVDMLFSEYGIVPPFTKHPVHSIGRKGRMQQTGARVVKAGEGRIGFLGGLGVRFMIPGEHTDNDFSLVEHPMRPRALAAPLHRH